MRVHRHQGGFTLIELLVAMTIIGIMAATAVLSLSVVTEDRLLRQESSRLIRVLTSVSDTAVFSLRPMALQPQSQAYRVVQRNNGEWQLPEPGQALFDQHLLHPSVRLSLADGNGGWNDGPMQAIAFMPEGTAGAALIRLLDTDTGRRALLSVAATGEVDVSFGQAGGRGL